MINRMAAIMVCLVLVFSMVSCDDQGKAVGYGSLSVEISNGDNSKTVRPADESLAFASYRIEGRHSTIEGRIVDETFTGGKIELDRLETGEWEFMVEGINKDGVVLAKSDTHIVTIKTNGTAKETYTLSWIVGHGTLRLSVKVQTSRVSTIECQLYDEDGCEAGTYVMPKADSRQDGEGFLVFERSFIDVPTGSYDATMTMKDKDGGMIGRALHPSVHIHDGLVSSYVFSWENFRNLLPGVDVPKVTNIVEGATTVSCDLTILLGTEEDGTTIFYSLDGKKYSQYQGGAIDLSKIENLEDSITVWTYAEKTNLNRSDVGTYTFNVEHNPDRANAVYTWNATEGGYECVATSKCKYHKSVECEAEKAVVSYQVITDSTCSKEGVGRFTAVFAKDGYTVQTKDKGMPVLEHELEYHEAKEPTCTEIGWSGYDTCTRCDYITKVEKPALGHNYVKTETKAPTCTETGMSENVCSRCNYTTYESIPAGHALEHHAAKEPTCTEIGWSAYDTCTRCDYTTYSEIVALGHDLVHHDAKEPNCTVGWESYDECTRGDYTTYKEIPAIGHRFVSFVCTVCNSRQMGPAGGYVFYDCDADNDSSINDGRGEDNLMSSECGWRYLEAAPADLRLVDGVPTVDSTKAGYANGTVYFKFGFYRETSDGSNICLSTKTGIGEGFNNTDILVSNMKESAYTSSSGTDTTSNYAARLCDVLEYEVNGEVFTDWFLPSKYELDLMYKNLHKKGLGSFDNGYYWSSSESSADYAREQGFAIGYQGSFSRLNDFSRVRPVRAF